MSATRQVAVGELLAKCAREVKQVGRTRWRFSLRNGEAITASARVEDVWLCLEAKLPRGGQANDARGAVVLLKANGRLRGGARFALKGDGGKRAVVLRSDTPLEEGVGLEGRVREACGGFREAAARWVALGRGGEGGKTLAGVRSANAASCPGGGTLQRACRDAWWEFAERAGGRLAVGLEVPGHLYQAVVSEEDGAVRWAAELSSGEGVAPVSRGALGILLLRVCGVVRMARAVVSEAEEAFATRLEVVAGAPASAGFFNHALSALSVGCALCGREVEVLHHDEAARAYLAARGWSSEPALDGGEPKERGVSHGSERVAGTACH